MASDSKNVCRTASQWCDGWLDERIVGAVLEGVKNPFSCAYRFIKLYGGVVQLCIGSPVNQRKEGKMPHQREHPRVIRHD
jgi:hypothetical protein